MRVGILGGGIAGLSAAYYLKKSALPISEILLFESSGRFGGWLNSKKIPLNDRHDKNVIFDSGPRTLRLASLENKELNTLKLALDLNLEDDIQVISKKHVSARNRFIFKNGKIHLIDSSLFKKNTLLPQRFIYYVWKDLMSRKPSQKTVDDDESIYDFISNHFDKDLAETLIDPVMKGICGGNIKELSASSLMQNVFEAERQYGSILIGLYKNSKKKKLEAAHKSDEYSDLTVLRQKYFGQSVWRLKSGIETLVDALVNNLKSNNSVKLYLNEPCEKISFDQNRKINVKTKHSNEKLDFVISALQAKNLAKLFEEDHLPLKKLLESIMTVNMVVVNLYFDKNVLPIKISFGYLIPSKENSPILGCIFDSIFDSNNDNHSNITVMLGSAIYNEYKNKDDIELLNLVLESLKKQINLSVRPVQFQISFLKDAIPQYEVGHKGRLNKINDYLIKNKIDNSLYLIGNSYNGIGVNDVVFNSRNICQNILTKNPIFK